MRGLASRLRSIKKSATPRRRGLRVGITTAAIAIGVIALAMSATPASAHEWNVESTSESCHTYSFGTMCTVTTTLFRHHDSWCAGGPPITWPLRVAWYSHCYRNQTTTYFP